LSELNEKGARYVVGGFAIRAAGYVRTIDIDLVIDTTLNNEALVYKALEVLPDMAAQAQTRRGFTTAWSVFAMK
jgi:hypothetical protein